MQMRKLGSSGIEVPVIMLGGNVFGWTVNESDSFRLLDAAFDAGLTFIDTADVYSRWVPGHAGGESETILGKWFARSGKREDVILATKVGMDMGNGDQGLDPDYIARAVDASLKRLQTDRIDLYQAHKDDDKTRLGDTLGAFDRLVEQGKVRFIGASNYSGARLQEAIEISKERDIASYQTLQPHYNLMERENYEMELAPVVAEYGLGVIPYSRWRAVFFGQVPQRGRRAGQGARGHGGQVSQRTRVWRDCGAGRAGPRIQLDSRQCRPGLADRAARHHRAIASATNEQQLADLVKATELELDRAAIGKLSVASAPSNAASRA